mmetsp:Transcript_16171/g.50125  ORF Transcript_16171/g.50125 Transcript_16171/m.50125 type:complete len:232 (-) Transcript_16171:832-1527(-)
MAICFDTQPHCCSAALDAATGERTGGVCPCGVACRLDIVPAIGGSMARRSVADDDAAALMPWNPGCGLPVLLSVALTGLPRGCGVGPVYRHVSLPVPFTSPTMRKYPGTYSSPRASRARRISRSAVSIVCFASCAALASPARRATVTFFQTRRDGRGNAVGSASGRTGVVLSGSKNVSGSVSVKASFFRLTCSVRSLMTVRLCHLPLITNVGYLVCPAKMPARTQSCSPPK